MIRSIFTNFSARLGVAVLNFIMLLVITHILGKGIYGQISVIALNVSYIHLISDLAGGPSLVYLTPRARLGSLLLTGSIWSFVNSIGIGLILIYTGIFPELYGKEVLLIGLLISLHSLNQNLLLGQERIKVYNILFFAQGILQILSLLIFIFLLKQADAYPCIIAFIISNAICYVIGLFLVLQKRIEPKIIEPRPLLLVLFANGFYTQAASVFLVMPKSISFNSMKANLPDGEGSVGIVNSAYSLASAIMLFGASVSAVVLSKVANHANHTETRTTVFRLAKLSLLFTLLAVGFFLILPAEFYTWLLGKDFSPVKNIFIAMSPGIIFISLGTVFSHYFSGAGKHIMNFASGIVTLIFAWLITDYLVRKYGANGAGMAASVTFIVMTLFIMTAFILVGKNPIADMKLLFPQKGDFKALITIFKKEK
ncbi:hypothetical protein BH09BAC5_BH09BAC5_20740 [soil metagenome]